VRSGQLLAVKSQALIQRLHLAPYGSLWLAAVIAAVLIVLFWKARQRYRALPELPPPAAPESVPDCMVIIPARNEERGIAEAVRSFPPDTVIVIDDFSEDRTPQLARKAGAGVLPAPPLPRNGIGKSNACAAGARLLTSRWVLFADADTRYEKGFLASVVAWAESSGLAVLSVYLRPEFKSLAEQILAPYLEALFFCSPLISGKPNPLFTGHCVLTRREPYVFMGTHGAIVTQLVEDLRLTQLAERHRLKVGVARAGRMGHVRSYQGLDGIREGVERQAFRYLVISSRAGFAAAAAAFFMCLWLPALVWLATGGLGMGRHGVTAIVFAFLPSILLLSWYETWSWALLAPIAVFRTVPILLKGIFSALAGRPILWKGRRVRAVS
jgi:cellulose synthase/poly-beta-1,6-N-acetylglucosamine synthase-like glycosyltransferase